MNGIRRTALRIVMRLCASQHNLRLAVMLYRNTIRTFDTTTEDISGLGRHYRLVGIYDRSATVEGLNDDLEFVLSEIKKERAE